MTSRIIYRRPISGLLSPTGTGDAAQNLQYPVYEGLVTDIILDHSHPDYATVDGYNVGMIKVRIFDIHHGISDDYLPWASPIDNTVLEFPLLGEVVSLTKIRGAFFYTRKIPIANRIQENAMLNLNSILSGKNGTLSAAASTNAELELQRHSFGNYFRPDSRVRPLKHFEGDTIIHGRMGQSVRLGSSRIDPSSKNLAPNIIIRVAQGDGVEAKATTDAVFGLVVENINKDPTSLWMVSDQVVPLKPTTITADSFSRSLTNPIGLFDGATAAMRSGRIILDSTTSDILLFSSREIYLNSFSGIGIDTDGSLSISAAQQVSIKSTGPANLLVDSDISIKSGESVFIAASKNTSILSNKIYLGSVMDDSEPIVGGTSLSIFLGRLILALMGGATVPSQTSSLPNNAPTGPRTLQHVITPTGPGQLNPIIVKELMKLYSELSGRNDGSSKNLPFSGAVFNSEDSYVLLKHEDSDSLIVKNDYTTETPPEPTSLSWDTSDDTYRVV